MKHVLNILNILNLCQLMPIVISTLHVSLVGRLPSSNSEAVDVLYSKLLPAYLLSNRCTVTVQPQTPEAWNV